MSTKPLLNPVRFSRGRVGTRLGVVVVRSEFGRMMDGVAIPVADATLAATEDATGQVSR